MDELVWITIEPEPERPGFDAYAERLAEEAIGEYEDDLRAGIAAGNYAELLPTNDDIMGSL